MLDGQRILAVVPARGGSKGIPDKNMRTLAGTSLIGWAARALANAAWVDRAVISTDSADYAAEAEHHGLAAPFLRPASLAGDDSPVVDALQHALGEMETRDGVTYDIVLIVEPSSPFRTAADLEATARLLVQSGADSAIAVSPLPAKSHPLKALAIVDGMLVHHIDEGRSVVGRQQLGRLYWRNGVCYALTRACLVEQRAVLGERCVAAVTEHPVVNIDEPWELDWAEFALERGHYELR